MFKASFTFMPRLCNQQMKTGNICLERLLFMFISAQLHATRRSVQSEACSRERRSGVVTGLLRGGGRLWEVSHGGCGRSLPEICSETRRRTVCLFHLLTDKQLRRGGRLNQNSQNLDQPPEPELTGSLSQVQQETVNKNKEL